MNVAKLFHELPLIADIEIVVSRLPEMFGTPNQAPRHSLLQRFERVGERSAGRFADQEVNMLRHDYITVDANSEAAPHALQGGLESLSGGGGGK